MRQEVTCIGTYHGVEMLNIPIVGIGDLFPKRDFFGIGYRHVERSSVLDKPQLDVIDARGDSVKDERASWRLYQVHR